MPNYVDKGIGENLWSEQDVALYNKLDFYLAKKQVKQFPVWETYSKLLPKKRWTPNMGTTMKSVSKEPSPVLRNQIFPNTIQSAPKKDIIEVRENAQTSQLHWQRVESQMMNVVPSFQDFLTDHVEAANKDITQKIQILQDMFLRTAILQYAPYMWVCGNTDNDGELEGLAHLGPNDAAITEVKTAAVLKAMIAKCNDTLTLKELSRLGTVMSVDEEVPFFEGTEGMEVNEGLKGKFALINNAEVWDNWQFDPFLTANRKIDMDIVTDKFRGNLWGRWTTMLERFPMRLDADGNVIAPQVLVDNAEAAEHGETKPNPAYKTAPYAIAWAVGAGGYGTIEVGPPPAAFAKGELGLKQFRALRWNGEVRLTKDVLVNVPDENNNVVQDTNKYGHYAQLISEVMLGVCPERRRCWIPVLYKRARLGNTL